MKLTSLLVVLCFATTLVYCNRFIDDFSQAQYLRHDGYVGGLPQFDAYSTLAEGNLFYARRIHSYKDPRVALREITIGNGDVVVTTSTGYVLSDQVNLEYWYNNDPLNDFPQGVTRNDNPFPLGYVDMSDVTGLIFDWSTPGFVFPGCSFKFTVRDANHATHENNNNYEIATDSHIVITANDLFGTLDRTRITYFALQAIIIPVNFHNLELIAAPTCDVSTNVNSAAAVAIPVNYVTPASLTVNTCGTCVAADFTGFSALPRDNVFWYSVSQQAVAYTATFSSQSFAGYNDAYLWVFDAQGNVLASVDNLSADLFDVTVSVDEIAIFVAIGAECSIESFTLDVSFSAVIVDLSLQLEEVAEDLTALINNGFTTVGGQLDDLSGQLTGAQNAITQAIGQSTTTVTGLITTETSQIDGEISDLDTHLGNVNTDINSHVDGKFTALSTSLSTSFDGVNQGLQNIADQITDQCGSSADGVGALSTYLTAQWTNWRNQQIIDKLVTGALVPAHYQTPASQGGILEDIYAFVVSTFNAKKSLADSQKTTPTSSTCKTGVDGAYCAFFYRFPSGSGSAQSSYQTAISSYNSWLGQARYAKAFQSLATAYNALFMGQN